jgi:hypothetical protein
MGNDLENGKCLTKLNIKIAAWSVRGMMNK